MAPPYAEENRTPQLHRERKNGRTKVRLAIVFFKNKMAADTHGGDEEARDARGPSGRMEQTRGEEIVAAVDGGMNRGGPPESPFCD